MKNKVEVVEFGVPSKNVMKHADKIIKSIANVGCNKLTISEFDELLNEIADYCKANLYKPC